MTSEARADRILDEFIEGADRGERHTSIRHGLARVLRHLADTEASYIDEEPWYAVHAITLTDLADALEAPTLPDRAALAHPRAPAMKPPLWTVVDEAWWSLVNTAEPHCDPPASDQAACVIRAVRDWLKPEGLLTSEDMDLQDLLTTEVDRAERGEVEHG